MRPIKLFISSLQISPELKSELATEELLFKHDLYLQLARYLVPVFPSITAEALSDLTGYSYLYFRFLLGLDELLDGPATGSGQAAHRLFTSIGVHEQAVRGLAQLFPQGSTFWQSFDACKQQYVRANLLEKRMSVERTSFTQTVFEELADGKSAVCYALVDALSNLSQEVGPVAALRRCLHHLHIAMQYLDDVEDFRIDWEQGQYTYAHCLVEAFLAEERIEITGLDSAELHPVLYTSGTASLLLKLSYNHYEQAIAIAQELGLGELASTLKHHAEQCAFFRADVDNKVMRAHLRAQQSALQAA